MLLCPPYSPNFAPSDFYFSRPLKDVVRRRKFQSDDDMVNAIRTWLHQQDKEWYQLGIHALIPCWWKAIEQYGQFVEN
jgi:hypothetical protein